MNNQTQSDVALRIAYIKETKTNINGEEVELVDWEDVRQENKYPVEDNNEGYIFGVYFLNEEEVIDAQWFLNHGDRMKFIYDNCLDIII